MALKLEVEDQWMKQQMLGKNTMFLSHKVILSYKLHNLILHITLSNYSVYQVARLLLGKC